MVHKIVTSRSIYFCRMNCMNKSGSKRNLPTEEGFLIVIQDQVIQSNLCSNNFSSNNTEFDNTCSQKKTILRISVCRKHKWMESDRRTMTLRSFISPFYMQIWCSVRYFQLHVQTRLCSLI